MNRFTQSDLDVVHILEQISPMITDRQVKRTEQAVMLRTQMTNLVVTCQKHKYIVVISWFITVHRSTV